MAEPANVVQVTQDPVQENVLVVNEPVDKVEIVNEDVQMEEITDIQFVGGQEFEVDIPASGYAITEVNI